MIIHKLAVSIVLTLLFQALHINLLAQVKLNGIVVNENGKCIPFVNIGIENTTVGTASYEDGTFQIEIPSDFSEDSLTFSAIGYKRIKIPVMNLVDTDSIFLVESEIRIDEVAIYSNMKEFPVVVDGLTQPNYGFLGLYWDGKYISDKNGGSAMAIYLNPDSRIVFLEKAELFIHNNRLRKFNLRLRIMGVQNGLPHDDLFNENILTSFNKKKGKLNVELSKHGILLKEPFFLVFEWIVFKDNSKNLRKKKVDRAITAFSVRQTDSFVGYDRKSSMAAWQRSEKVVVANVSYSVLD
jgi:hypothetical protein